MFLQDILLGAGDDRSIYGGGRDLEQIYWENQPWMEARWLNVDTLYIYVMCIYIYIYMCVCIGMYWFWLHNYRLKNVKKTIQLYIHITYVYRIIHIHVRDGLYCRLIYAGSISFVFALCELRMLKMVAGSLGQQQFNRGHLHAHSVGMYSMTDWFFFLWWFAIQYSPMLWFYSKKVQCHTHSIFLSL